MKPPRRAGTIAAAITVVLTALVVVTLATRQMIPRPGSTSATATGVANGAACQGSLSWVAGASDVSLLAAAATSPRDAWAVGVEQTHAVIQHWDGAGWKDAARPALGTTSSALLAVAAVDARDAWAVGRAGLQPLIVHWNGVAWTDVAVTPAAAYSSQFSALAVVAPDDVWAVGSALQTPSSTAHMIAAHWDGSSWRMAPAPQGQTVAALTASPGGGVWALITAMDGTQQVVRWDGQAWRQLPAPDPTAERLDLRTIAANAEGVVWAAGSYWPQEENWAQPIAERWDGRAWSRVPVSAMEARGAWLTSLAVAQDGTVWAAGTFRNPNTRLSNIFLRQLGGQGGGGSIYPNSYTNPHNGDSFNVSQVAWVPGAHAVWLVGSIGSAPDPSLPPIDSNLPRATGAFVLRYC